METLLIVCIIGFITYIAGRSQVGTNFVTREYAQFAANDMYQRGLAVGHAEALKAALWEADKNRNTLNEVTRLDEYINGYALAMKTLRDHGPQAEAIMKAHMAEVLIAREKAIIANPDYRSVLHL